MMGDNRYCSKDSRYWGFVPRENVRGRPMFVYYSYRPGDEPSAVCAYETSDRRCRSSPMCAGADRHAHSLGGDRRGACSFIIGALHGLTRFDAYALGL